MLTWDFETRRRKNTCSVFVYPSPAEMQLLKPRWLGNWHGNKWILFEPRENGSETGETGGEPRPIFFSECVTQCGLTGDRNNGNRTRNVTNEKNNLIARWQASCEQEGEEAKGHTEEAEQMRKIVRYRKNAIPPERHPNGGRRGSRRKQAAI